MNSPLRACPDIGVWRAWLDHEDHSPHLADHLTTCAGCRSVVADLRGGAQIVSTLFDRLSPARLPSGAEVAVARERLALRLQREPVAAAPSAHVPAEARSASTSQEPIPMFLTRISTPWRVAASGLAAALVLSLAVAFNPDAQAAAAGFLAQFRPQQITAVEVTPQSQAEIMKTLNSLGNLGTVKTPNGAARPEAAARGAAEQTKTVTLAEASQALGFAVETPDPTALPAGLDKTPRVQLMPSSQVRFTFDKTMARNYFQKTGHPEATMPDKFDGATLVVSIPSAALLQYGDKSSKEALIVGQAGELVVDVEGNVSLTEVRDYLLTVPGLPPAVVSQLKKITNWNQTLPLPVPVDQVNWQSTSFKGHQGLLLNDNSGVGSAAIWYEGGHMYGLAGSLKATELKRIAETLAVRN